ncbi:uncharacterized protein LOC112461543 [Temnothorax curvispinosus]|uniref:Uncharacterized protein LOC112461543 n=1 Tax=Temnothorax curvispinosus TaxID=300111 RepID=A0A6J1QNK5_9HYME|nr:uncharacterized protein LOC112461543 [Temnothorax curvispinosus]
MVLFQFFTTAILLLSITSGKTYSVPYQSIQLAFSITPKLIYTSEPNPAFSGYSYTTQDFNGGESNVVFTIGADSMSRLKNEMDSMKMSKGYSQGDKDQENIISSEQQSESIKTEENSKNQDLDSNIKVLNEEKKSSKNSEADNLIEHQTNFQQVSLMNVPYSALGENLLNLHLPVFPRYQISSNVIQSPYYPHNPYARLELPLHNFGFYNSVPLFYQAATIIPDNNTKPASTAVENMKESVEPRITKSSQLNATNSESSSIKSSIIESRLNQESTNGIEETSSSLPAISMNFESTTTSEKIREEIPTDETTVTSQSSVEQTTDDKASSTEPASTETSLLTSLLTKKSDTATSKRCTGCMKRLN